MFLDLDAIAAMDLRIRFKSTGSAFSQMVLRQNCSKPRTPASTVQSMSVNRLLCAARFNLPFLLSAEKTCWRRFPSGSGSTPFTIRSYSVLTFDCPARIRSNASGSFSLIVFALEIVDEPIPTARAAISRESPDLASGILVGSCFS